MTRTEYKAAYSAARKFDRFQLTFWRRLRHVPRPTFYQFLFPGFSECRQFLPKRLNSWGRGRFHFMRCNGFSHVPAQRFGASDNGVHVHISLAQFVIAESSDGQSAAFSDGGF